MINCLKKTTIEHKEHTKWLNYHNKLTIYPQGENKKAARSAAQSRYPGALGASNIMAVIRAAKEKIAKRGKGGPTLGMKVANEVRH